MSRAPSVMFATTVIFGQKSTVSGTGVCNHNQMVFEEMLSSTALTMHLGMKTTF